MKPTRLLVLLTALCLVALPTGVAQGANSSHGILPPGHPAVNIPAAPNFLASGQCHWADSTSLSCANPCANGRLTNWLAAYINAPTCSTYVLGAYNAARAKEGLGPLTLPSNWYALTPQEQLFVLIDIERVSRGLPPYLGLNRILTATAQAAAARQTYPNLTRRFPVGFDAQGYYGMAGAWSLGHTTLGVMYGWMYDDGWGGSLAATRNIDCTWAGAAACWAHRTELLGNGGSYNPGVGVRCTTCEVGVGFVRFPQASSMTMLIELPAHQTPKTYFSWARDVVPFLPTTAQPTLMTAATQSLPSP